MSVPRLRVRAMEEIVPDERSESYDEGPSLARRVAVIGLAGIAGLCAAVGLFVLTVAYDLPIPFLR